MKRVRVIIMGAAGRDFHNFNVCFRNDPNYRVAAFTAAQIPFIAGRRYPAALAGRLYPRGIPIFDEAELEKLLDKHRINQVVFAYSDISYGEIMHKASLVMAHGADFRLIGPDAAMLKSKRPVISVCAVRTGCGKSQITRHVAALLKAKGVRPVVVRHPMPYGELAKEAVERFSRFEDLTLYRCTIEEREEYEPLIRQGTVVYAGVDYESILRAAEREGDVIIWDGGNNDFPFFRPDLEMTVADPLRSGDETAYFPAEVNLRRASVIIINKINAADAATVCKLEAAVSAVNGRAQIVRTASEVTAECAGDIRGKRVLVVEDGPSVTHGNLPSGAGLAAAHRFGAAEVVDPRPFAVGSLADTFRTWPHIGPVLPAMGYSEEQRAELRQTIEAVPCDMVLSATPVDLASIVHPGKPVCRVFYEIMEEEGEPLKGIICAFLADRGF